jgi:translation initiation factor IF-3
MQDIHNINGRITAPKVRLVGENVEPGIYDTLEALRIAKSRELDLVEIASKMSPPVCKIIDYSKFKYDQKKKAKTIKSKSAKTALKEIRFSPNTSTHDFNFKLRHAIKFLSEGSTVRLYVHFAGRSIAYKERGELLLLQFVKELDEYGKIENMPKLEGRRMIVMVVPKGKN